VKASILKFIPHLLVVAVVLSMGLCTRGYPQINSAIGNGVCNRNEIASAIKRNSNVPLRLPSYFPVKKSPIYAIAKAVNRSGYVILLVTESTCNGQDSCAYGTIRGEATSFKSNTHARPFPVKLSGNINGQFFKPQCDPKCGEATIRWREAGFYYSIRIKAGLMHSLIEIANSTGIAVPPPPPEK
jgi:hypothetical protein